METIVVHKGDKGYIILFPCTDSAGVAKDLTLYTINIKAWIPGNPETLIINSTCTKSVTPTDGYAYYTVTENDFAYNTVRYQAELELIQSGIIENTEQFVIIVKESA